MPLKDTNNQDCALALYNGDKSKIHNLCNFRFVPNAVTPTIRQLDQSHILVINTTSLSLNCPSGIKDLQPCHFCIVQIPCNCSVSSPQYSLAKRHTGCHDNSGNTSVMHLVNLILLHKFFGIEQISHIFPNSTFPTPLNISIKPLKFYNHKYHDIIADDQKTHLNLDTIIKNAKEDKVIYASIADPILDSNFLDGTDNTQFILTIAAISLSGLSIICCFLLYRKHKALMTFMTLSQSIKHVASMPTQLPSFIYTAAPTLPTSTPWIQTIPEVLPSYITYVTLVLMLTICFIYIYKYCKKSTKPYLVLEITNSNISVTCFITLLPTCIKQCHFSASKPVSINSVKFNPFPSLSINWSNFTAAFGSKTNIIKPPKYIKLGLLQTYKIKQILSSRSPFVTQIWIAHHNYCIPVDLCTSACPLCIDPICPLDNMHTDTETSSLFKLQ